MEFARADFDNAAVAKAKQVSTYGYHYGKLTSTIKAIEQYLIQF